MCSFYATVFLTVVKKKKKKVWGGEAETDCTLERGTEMLFCWTGVLPEITLNS